MGNTHAHAQHSTAQHNTTHTTIPTFGDGDVELVADRFKLLLGHKTIAVLVVVQERLPQVPESVEILFGERELQLAQRLGNGGLL
jgi:hypothetical protein